MCNHRWRRVHEEFLLGGSFPIGYRCIDCNEFISNSSLTPKGIGGTLLEEDEIVGPHGGIGRCGNGSAYKRQIFDRGSKMLTIERPDGKIETRITD